MAMATVCNSQEPNHRCYLYTFIKNDFYCSSFFFVLVHINIESNITYTPPKHTQMRMLPKLYCFMFASRIDNVHHFVCLRNLKKTKNYRSNGNHNSNSSNTCRNSKKKRNDYFYPPSKRFPILKENIYSPILRVL